MKRLATTEIAPVRTSANVLTGGAAASNGRAATSTRRIASTWAASATPMAPPAASISRSIGTLPTGEHFAELLSHTSRISGTRDTRCRMQDGTRAAVPGKAVGERLHFDPPADEKQAE